MKKFNLLLALLVFTSLSFAQQAEWCGTMEALQKYHEEHPDKLTEFQMDLLNKVQDPSKLRRDKSTGNFIIPMVVHVVHFNGQGNISKAQIEDGIRIINEDFQKLNPDTNTVRNVFKPHIADFGIQFELAKIDPVGNPTEGITRHNSHFTFPQSDRNRVKTIVGWDPFSYLNVWIVNQIGNNVLGFAQFPANSAGAASTYGIVCNADEWGSIEVAQSTDGRTVTHEVGHCLDLLHTFQGSCGSLCHASGDFVCDTPPQFDDNNNSCNFSLNTCSNDASGGIASRPNPYTSNVPDQLENYMGYGLTCLAMFTEGQKDRVMSAISNYVKLDSITTAYNNIQTGTNPGYIGPTPKPIVEIHDFDKFTCEGGTITFNEDSYGGPLTNYQWSFPGGSPSSSTSPNPTITYNTQGNYDVTLKISNAGGADSLTLTNYVHVEPTAAKYSAFNYNEGFENATNFGNDWIVIDKYLPPTFEVSTFASQSGNNSIWINNSASVYNGSRDQLISPSLKMADVLNPSISMDVSYRRRNSSSNDQLRVSASLDCGRTWVNLITMSPVFYAFDNQTQTSNFFPTNASQWKTVTIPSQFIPANIKTGNSVKFMIELEKDGGNNMFIDNFRINGQVVGIDDVVAEKNDLILYPNPATSEMNIKLNLVKPAQQAKIYIQNVLGKTVENVYTGSFTAKSYQFIVNTEDYSPGIYFVSTEVDGERITRKLVVK